MQFALTSCVRGSRIGLT